MTSASKISGTVKNGWVSIEGGYEITQSPAIIISTMKWLQESRAILSLLSKGYQSGATILYKFTGQHVFIDKPKDWPGKKIRVRVVFRNEAKVWMHFITTILAQSKDGLKCSRPKELFMLQRRNHYRVILPQNSRASFVCDNVSFQLVCKDLSAGGLLMVTRNSVAMQGVSHITDIVLTIPSEEGFVPEVKGGILNLYIKEADVVREIVQEGPLPLFCHGVRFYCDETEEEKILRYVRQRELEVLRKGVSD